MIREMSVLLLVSCCIGIWGHVMADASLGPALTEVKGLLQDLRAAFESLQMRVNVLETERAPSHVSFFYTTD